MAEGFVIAISIAFSIFIVTSIVVFIMRKRKAKQNVGVVYDVPPPGQQQQQYPPTYGQQVIYVPGQNTTGYPNAPGYPAYPPGYLPQHGYPAQPAYPTQTGVAVITNPPVGVVVTSATSNSAVIATT